MSIDINAYSSITKEQIASLFYLMNADKDYKNTEKLLDLYDKLQSKEYIIGFSGHFSAGKSSMINYLLDEDLLPKSPIPTSANIVKITSGSNHAKLYFNSGDYTIYEEPYDIDVIKEYCKDKETISKIELSSTNNQIPVDCSLIDTPGIDAADDTDRLITESSLHLIDHMIYIVDYNHVQSEVNLLFLQKLQKMKIPYDLIVNQIDKHNEEEIKLENFKKTVKQTFDQWSLNPDGTYFTSIKYKYIKINELEVFEKYIQSKFKGKKVNTPHNLQYIINEHEDFLKHRFDERISELDLWSVFNDKDVDRLKELEVSISKLKNKPNDVFKQFNELINQTLNNAYIMPAELREVARTFLEAQEKGFKIGIFNSKKKTVEEVNHRTKLFLSSLLESIETNLKWKIRDKLHELVQQLNFKNEKLTTDIQNLEITYGTDDISRLTKQGAKVNGEYLLNYTNEISNDVKNKYKHQLNEIMTTVTDLAKERYYHEQVELENEYNELNKQFVEQKELLNLEDILKDKRNKVYQTFEAPTENQEQLKKIEEKIKEKYNRINRINNDTTLKKQPKTKIETKKKKYDENSYSSVKSTLESIDKTLETIDRMPGFETMIKELENKRHRLTERKFTIALFGAFSAGKSSFANALIGERLLPTSPNPTTAVINKLAPPNKYNQHNTIIILFKTNITLSNDLYTIVKNIAQANEIKKTDDYQDILNWIKENDIQHDAYLEQMYQSFLQAMLIGYEADKHHVGKQLEIPIEQFEAYVTDETIACYIEEVTLYYDCSITRKGITLVDTPGADSINARHTNVAFNYIKHADTILYVTYYNHALSRADKNFLMQLGRVKDTFELDKLYFLINAIDLAVDEKEVNLVTNYVEDQLLKLGIRFPKIYPLSSKIALEDQHNNRENKPMQQFSNELFYFIENELSKIIVQSVDVEINRIRQMITNHIETRQLNQQEQAKVRVDLLDTQEKASRAIFELSSEVYEERLKQRIDKQLYYVEERLSIRFHDMFKEKFNPTTVTKSGQAAMKELEFNMNDLVDYTGYELLQEVRAVSLRIEAFIRMLLKEANNNIVEQVKAIDNRFIVSALSDISFDTLEYKQPLSYIENQELITPLNSFKGTKSFFEKNEKEVMKEAIYKLLSPYINNYLDDINNLMFDAYNQQWNNTINKRQHHIASEIDEYVNQSLDMMTQSTNVDELNEKGSLLDKIITEF